MKPAKGTSDFRQADLHAPHAWSSPRAGASMRHAMPVFTEIEGNSGGQADLHSQRSLADMTTNTDRPDHIENDDGTKPATADEARPTPRQEEGATGFADLGLSDKVLRAVAAAGFDKPTEIQKRAIPPALMRKDVLGLAQTGSGKTAAFVLPMLTLLERGRARARMPRTLILEPTRELAAQVHDAFQQLGQMHKLKVALLIGGVSFDEQSRIIDRGADVLIATPGRLLDHFERGKLLLTGVEILVIDEADRMLDMGFIPDIERIVGLLPFTRQTLFFSATMPREIQRLVDQFLHLPVRVEAQPPSSTAETIDQRLVLAPSEERAKRAKLREVIDARKEDVRNAIVFANRKKTVEILAKSLVRHGYSAGSLHGDMDQYARLETLQKFRDNEITYLVASDVAARGLDIPEVSHVFNFDVPVSPEDYVHRIGRTGRAGRKGEAITLVMPDDLKAVGAIQELIGKEIPWEGEAPSEEEIEQARARGRRRRGGSRRKESGARKEGGARGARRGGGSRRRAEEGGQQAAEDAGRKKRWGRSKKHRGGEAATARQEGSAGESPREERGATNGAPQKTGGSERRARGARGEGSGKGGKQAGFDESSLPAFLARPVERE